MNWKTFAFLMPKEKRHEFYRFLCSLRVLMNTKFSSSALYPLITPFCSILQSFSFYIMINFPSGSHASRFTSSLNHFSGRRWQGRVRWKIPRHFTTLVRSINTDAMWWVILIFPSLVKHMATPSSCTFVDSGRTTTNWS